MNGQNSWDIVIFTNVEFTGKTIPLFYHMFEAVEIVS